MQRAQQRFEYIEQCAARGRCGCDVIALQHRLRQFQVPVAELVPRELIQRGRGKVQTVVG